MPPPNKGMPLLRQAIETPEGLVLIVDSAGAPGHALWRASLAESVRPCVLLALDKPAADCGAPRAADRMRHVHDVYTAERGALPSRAADVRAAVEQTLSSSAVLFVDSATSLITGLGITDALALLSAWQRGTAAVVTVAHADVLDDYTIAALERMARVVVRVGDESASSSSSSTLRSAEPSLRVPCTVSLLRRTGKIVREESTLALLPGAQVAFRTAEPRVPQQGPAEEPPKPPPDVEVSFNLALTPAQREARGRVVLPFMRAQQHDAHAPPAGDGGGGAITYHLDTEDDFDEEDPDDDLDF